MKAATFPDQFSGISVAIRLTGENLGRAITAITGQYKKDGGCGHKHNIAVDSANKTVYVSPLGARCLSDAIDRGFKPRPKQPGPWVKRP